MTKKSGRGHQMEPEGFPGEGLAPPGRGEVLEHDPESPDGGTGDRGRAAR